MAVRIGGNPGKKRLLGIGYPVPISDAAPAASTSRGLATPFQTRTTASRRVQAPLWSAGYAPAPAAPQVVPYAAWAPAPVRRRRTTERTVAPEVPLQWQYIAPTVAAILKPERPKIVAFRRTLIEQPQQPSYPAAPPTGPPVTAWLAAAYRRVSQRRRIQRLADQPAYPATPATPSNARQAVATFETRRIRGRRLLLSPDVLGVAAAPPPVVTPYLDAPRTVLRRDTARRLVLPSDQITYPPTPAPIVSDVATTQPRVARTRTTERRLVQALVAPVFPATPAAPVTFAALLQPPRRRRKGRAGLFLSAGGSALSVPSAATPAVYPSYVQGGFHARRITERRLVRVLDAPVHPVTPPPSSSNARALTPAFETRLARGRRALLAPNVLGVAAAPPVTSEAPQPAWRLPTAFRTEFARRIQPAAPQLDRPVTPPPAVTPISAIVPSRSIRRRGRAGLFLGGGTWVHGVGQPEAAWRLARVIKRREVDRRLRVPLSLLERPQTPPVAPQPEPAFRLKVALRMAPLGRVLQPAAPQLEHPETPPVIVVPPLGGDDKPDARKYPGWDKKRSTLKRSQELRLEEDIKAIYRRLTDEPTTAARATELVATVAPAAPSEQLLRELARRSLAADRTAVEIEIALRLLLAELEEAQDNEDAAVLAMLLAQVL